MENIFIDFLPPWVETGLQPAFYDKESGTVLQQTARMYAKVNEIIKLFNKISGDFTTLYNYVHDYFDNLDVQTEVNNKLDAMVEDGTMAEIINQEIFGELNTRIGAVEDDITNNIKPDIQTNSNNITDLQTYTAKNTTDINNLKLKEIRTKESDRYYLMSNPLTNSWFSQFPIYQANDKRNYKIGYNLNSFKQPGNNTYYVDPTAPSSGTAGTAENPDNNIRLAHNRTTGGDTIILKAGIYRRSNFKFVDNSDHPTKSLNYIADGLVILTNSDELSWSQNETYGNVYQATRSSIANVIDIRDAKNKVFSRLIQKSSIAECSTNIGSYYTDGTTVYVNIGEEVTNNKVVVNLSTGTTPLSFMASNLARQWYLENLICLAGDRHIISAMSQTSYRGTLIAKGCYFLFATDANSENGNGITLYGTNSLLVDCEASFNGSDGISYKGYTGFKCNGVEINCKAASNGYNSNTQTSNGSTAHDGCLVLRYKGNYFNNRGANVCDVSDNTITANIECNAFDCIVQTNNSYDADFCAQQAGTTMYLYNCFAKGYSAYNIYSYTGATVNVDNCEYNNTGGSGTINIAN